MVALWEVARSRKLAQQLEYKIKSLTHDQKIVLINQPNQLPTLASRWGYAVDDIVNKNPKPNLNKKNKMLAKKIT